MKLKKVNFENFKSIKKDSLNITHNCMILVGKNEAGKSNILKGIAGGLSKKANALPRSFKRKRTSNEKDLKYNVSFVFELEQIELDAFEEYINNIVRGDFLSEGDQKITNRKFIEQYCSRGIFRYDLEENTRVPLYYAFSEDIKLNEQLLKLAAPYHDIPSGSIIKDPKGDVVNGTECKLNDLLAIFSSYLTKYIAEHLPRVYYWENEEKYLLPSSVSLSSFQNNPATVPSLKTLFNLAGYDNIAQSFIDAREESGDLTNLFQNVGEKATTEFRKKWPDLKNVSFVLHKDGDEILIKVMEKMQYNMDERSDGFKHFVSILLALSSQVELKQIDNAIILIDEPDRSLYPNAAKSLRDELLKLSNNNIVIYATHSPFMIDNDTCSRHVIVSKTQEITHLSSVTEEEESYQKDSVLLNAMGTSRFEYIKEVNIIFEGWSDYHFFHTALQATKKEYKPLKTFFDKIGTTFSHGVSSIKHITPILLLANKNVFILSDADSAAKTAQKTYLQENGYKREQWITFSDLGFFDKETIEDFVSDESLFADILNKMNRSNIDLNERGKKGIMAFLTERLSKDERLLFKENVAKQISWKQIDPSYYELLEELKSKIENATEDD